ncbi:MULTISPECIES: hypothetical protein [unclassified Variovorax]|jgi:hypothetical protein|uniref:hypothetical protein n=1 Tax=unclassified Variovorax TaxID=663243 RepID=UPI000F7E0837|nr:MULTISPECIES: hypothetical protein [unclassified Variovorax]RSZ31199.1 hypothetical protein EJO70_31905 [Variovorax sp. 553]RSZ31615.1 hypothetical protein EJO71_31910 [Variovorax sp. 679]
MGQGISFSSGLMACIAAALLTACGGGGGGGGGGGIPFLPVVPTTPVTLSGTATYESVPNPSGHLVYADTAVKPVRGAFVEVLDATSGSQLVTTSTNDSGAYSVSVPANTNVIVRVRAQLTRTGALPSWDVTVRDNTQSSAIYSMQSSAFSTGSAALSRDLRASSGWGGSSYTSQRVSGPFAIMDTVYTAMQKVMSAAPATAFPSLKVFWSVNNTNASGSIAQGQIGTTFFIGRSSGAEIYVLGKEDVDTDEFDAPVIAHEWGHYYQASFSRDDSTGGAHSTNERVDRRLAFSEGWGNGWSGIALGRSNYVDSGGPGQAQGGSLDLTKGPTATNPGWFSESSIQSIFWNLNQQAGFKPIHDTMTSALFRSGAPVTSIHPFTAAFNSVASGNASTLATLLAGQSISAASNDPYGAQENNNGGTPSVSYVLPMYTTATVGGSATQACVTNTADPQRQGNKLGSYAYLRFTAPANRNYQFTVSPPAGSSPNFVIYRGGAVSRNTNTVSLSIGEYVLVVNDVNNAGANTCFSVSIQ